MDGRLNNILRRHQARGSVLRERLSSGSRINHSADDSAGLAVSTILTHRTGARFKAGTNGREAVGYMTMKDAYMDEAVDMLHRMRELAVRSSSETVNDSERNQMMEELNQIKQSYSRNLTGTFNDKRLFTDSMRPQTVSFQVGINNTKKDRIVLSEDSLDKTWQKTSPKIRITKQRYAQASLGYIDGVLSRLMTDRSLVAAVSNRVDEATQSNREQIALEIAAEGRVRDADFASETSELTRIQIVSQASIALMSQVQDVRKVALQLL
jgi:flagellin